MKIDNKFKILIILLACIITFNLFFITSTFAKYITTLGPSTRNRAIAKWDVSANLPTATVNLVANENNESYTLTVSNNSEVAAMYSITLSELPYGTMVSLDNGDYVTLQENSRTITFENVGTINANASAKTNSHILKFKTAIDAEAVNSKTSNVKVTFSQKRIS